MEWSTLGGISYVILWVVVLIQVVLTLALARLVGQLSRRFPPSGARVIDPGPEIGTVVENWEGTDLLGKPVSIQFPRERGVLLLYLSPHCSACGGLLPSAKRFFREIAETTEGVWVMALGSQEAQTRYVQENGLVRHAVVAAEQLPPSWRVQGAPFALWVDAAGQVKAKGMVNHREHLESLRNAVESGHTSLEGYASALAEEEEQERERKGEVRSEGVEMK